MMVRGLLLVLVVCSSQGMRLRDDSELVLDTQKSFHDGVKPNIVLYLADDVGLGMVNQHAPEYSFADDVTIMEKIPEKRRIRTPTLEKLAREGKRFMRSYAGSPVCGPSRHSMMTGVQIGMAETRGNGFGAKGSSDVDIEDGRSTIGKVLKRAGYKTAAFGKWGMASGNNARGSPCKQGFDYFFGNFMHAQMGWAFPKSTNTCTSKSSAAKVVQFPENKKASEKECLDTDKCTYFDHMIRDKALEFILKDHGESPFFVYWAPNAGHMALYENVDKAKNCKLMTHPIPTYGRFTSGNLTGTGRDSEVIRGMMSMVEYIIDDDLKRLLDTLRQKRIDDNTLIIFASDNGPHMEVFADMFYDPLVDLTGTAGLNEQGYKRQIFEGGIRSPTVAWWPGKIPAGTKSYYPFMLYDLPLTLASVAGIPDSDASLNPFKVPNAGGVSLHNLLVSKTDKVVSASTRPWVYSEICFTKAGEVDERMMKRRPCRSIFALDIGCSFAYFDLTEWPKKMYKLVKNDPSWTEPELYDIVSDPFEKYDLAPNMMAKVESLMATRKSIRTPICSLEERYEKSCFPDDECNFYSTSKQDCQQKRFCKYSSKAKPYKCQRIACNDRSNSEEDCVNNKCMWRPWLRSNERCVNSFDALEHANLCSSYSAEPRLCKRDRSCRYDRNKSRGNCLKKSCPELWNLQSICQDRHDCIWDPSLKNKTMRCQPKEQPQ